MMAEMMVEMMVVMTSARTTRTSAINIKRNAMRNITNRNAQRPVANVEEMMAEMMVEMMKVDVNSQIIRVMAFAMMETTTKDAAGMVVIAALEMMHQTVGIPIAKNVNALIHLLVAVMMMMMVAMTSARTTRTSAINIKKNAMRNITNRNAQRPVANVKEMMVVMTLVMMVSARICG